MVVATMRPSGGEGQKGSTDGITLQAKLAQSPKGKQLTRNQGRGSKQRTSKVRS